MRLISSIFILLLQCVSPVSYAAKGHTTNNGGNLAEIRFTEAWNEFARVMAPCLTKANLCGLTEGQRQKLQSTIENIANRPLVMPGDELLYDASGAARSEAEMVETVLAIAQDCGGALASQSIAGLGRRAMEFSDFHTVRLFDDQTWYVFQRDGLYVEDVHAVHDLTMNVRKLLRLSAQAPVKFKRIWVQRQEGLVEIGGRIEYHKDTLRNNGFTFTIRPFTDGSMPKDIQPLVIK